VAEGSSVDLSDPKVLLATRPLDAPRGLVRQVADYVSRMVS
jgi:hypothetical protein